MAKGSGWFAAGPRCALLLIAVSGSSCVLDARQVPPGRRPTTETRLAQFVHDKWTQSDGAPTSVSAIAQTPDGYIWLGTREGLWRFDGAVFERIPAPNGTPMFDASVQRLMVTSRGKLWMGFGQSAGAAVYEGGGVVDMRMPRPPPVVTNIIEGPAGAIWVEWGGISQRLWRLSDGAWELADKRLGLPAGYLMNLMRTRSGGIWAPVMAPNQAGTGLAYLPPGADRFRWFGGKFDYPQLSEDRRGRIWVTDRRATSVVRSQTGTPVREGPVYPAIRDVRLPDLAFDRHGGAWGSTRTNGIFRIAGIDRQTSSPQAQVEHFAMRDGLTSDITKQTFADRHGDIWIATEGGLDRFRFADIQSVATIPSDPIAGIELTAARDGTVYAVARNTLYRIAVGARPTIRMNGVRAEALCPARDGAVWLVQRKHILKIDARVLQEPFATPSDAILACAEDGLGRMWVLTGTRDAWWHDAGGWHRAAQAQSSTIGSGIAAGLEGVAFASNGSILTIIARNVRRRLDISRLSLGDITNVDSSSRGYLVTTTSGLVRIDGKRIQYLDSGRYPWLKGLKAIVQTQRGETWLYGAEGVSRVATASLDAAFHSPGLPIRRRLFDFRDGLPSGPQRQGFVGEQAVLDAAGRLWLATSTGLATIDPKRVEGDRPPLQALIRSIAAGSNIARDPTDVTLAAGTTSVRLSYTAVSLAAPERVQFQYRLEGVDDDWIYAGSRRVTTYTNLKPGKYRFRVMVADDDGQWNPHGATLELRIVPTFVQGWTFRLLCGLGMLALLWAIHRLRIRAVARQVRARMDERHDERERIARELHDTLLQSVHALILRFQHVAEQLPAKQPARKILEDALDSAEAVIAQGRDRVKALRPPNHPDDAERLLTGIVQAHHFRLPSVRTIESRGDRRPLTASAAEEIAAIANEALFNIARHAQARRLHIAILYSQQALTMTIHDDGVGLEAMVLREGMRDGHYGLIGMRERARKLSADIIFDNGPAGGAEVTLVVPASTAFGFKPTKPSRRSWWRWSAFRRKRSIDTPDHT